MELTGIKKGEKMKKQILYDLTSFNGAIDSLGEYLDLTERQIGKYISEHKTSYSTVGLLDYYNIDYDKLFESDLKLVALHVTTNKDECQSIKKFGLVNLQQAILLDTPLGQYLKNEGVYIDIDNKEIHFKDRVYYIDKKYKGIRDSDKDFVPYKLYEDYQVNSFLSYENVLEYGVQNMPEFLHNLSRLLNSNDIGFNWMKQKNNCYIVKFITPFSNCANDTFFTGDDSALNKNDFKYFDNDELELMKRKWLIYQSLSVITNSLFSNIVRELYCPLRFEVTVPFCVISKIYTPSEYVEEYRINE
jgi:hypothetical protein